MNNEKIRAYRIISHQFLTLVRIEFPGGSDSLFGKIFEIFKQRNLALRFLASEKDSHGAKILYLGVELLSEETVGELIDALRGIENRKEIALISPISMAMLYGPHFGEMPGIFGLTFSAFVGSGIIPLAISASSSSLSWLFPSGQFKKALEVLHGIFEFPQAFPSGGENSDDL
jgi:aspartokinase